MDAVPPGTGTRFTIDIRPGVYAGQVIVPADKPNILLRGRGADPGRVVITDDRASGTPRPDGGTWGTSGSASVTVDAADFTATNLTFANSFDEAAHPEITARQAVALLSRADRLVFDNVRFLGNQDTLYLNSPAAAVPSRIYLHRCYVEGDVDFVFGRGTAVFDRCRIHSLTRGSTTNNGYVTAPSTSVTNPYGLLFAGCAFTSDAPPASVYLGSTLAPQPGPERHRPDGDPRLGARRTHRPGALDRLRHLALARRPLRGVPQPRPRRPGDAGPPPTDRRTVRGLPAGGVPGLAPTAGPRTADRTGPR
nr:hypothetical protein GCM10020092_062970 [Actinoplanes digitatis]